jgi:hypothetical protein
MFNHRGFAGEEQDEEDSLAAIISSSCINSTLTLTSLLERAYFDLGNTTEARQEESRSPSPQTPILNSSSSHAPMKIKEEQPPVRPLSNEDAAIDTGISDEVQSRKNKSDEKSGSEKASINIDMAEVKIESKEVKKKPNRGKKAPIDYRKEYSKLKSRVAILEPTINKQQEQLQVLTALVKAQAIKLEEYAQDPVPAIPISEKSKAAREYRKLKKEMGYSPTLFSSSSEDEGDAKQVQEDSLQHKRKRKQPN